MKSRKTGGRLQAQCDPKVYNTIKAWLYFSVILLAPLCSICGLYLQAESQDSCNKSRFLIHIQYHYRKWQNLCSSFLLGQCRSYVYPSPITMHKRTECADWLRQDHMFYYQCYSIRRSPQVSTMKPEATGKGQGKTDTGKSCNKCSCFILCNRFACVSSYLN